MVKDFTSMDDLLAWYKEMGMEVPLHITLPTVTAAPVQPSPIKIAVPTTLNAKSPVVPFHAEQPEAKRQIAPTIMAATAPNEAVFLARKLADNAKTLEELKEAVFGYNACALKNTAMNTVFCDGNPQAKLMLIGEAPGASEDAQGIPFCGESGKLLDAMFAAIGYNRSRFYITNSLFWRPPGNRRPTPEEVAMCLPFVEKHIALIQPKLLVLVGATAASALLTTIDGITKLRGKPHTYHNQYLTAPIPTFAIYHPSYLLRQPTQKRQAWHDLLRINQFLLS